MVLQQSFGQRWGDVAIHVSKVQILFTQQVIASFALYPSVIKIFNISVPSFLSIVWHDLILRIFCFVKYLSQKG